MHVLYFHELGSSTNLVLTSYMHTVICPNLPQPANGAVTYSDFTVPRAEGSTATYNCNAGYASVGNYERMCTSSGWSGSNPLCRGTDSLHCLLWQYLLIASSTATCSDLTVPTNGVISYSPAITPRLEGTVATHRCNAGYELSPPGSVERTCQSDQTWTARDLTCIGMLTG